MSHPRINPNGRFVTAGPVRVLVFTPLVDAELAWAELKANGVEVFALGTGRVDLGAAMGKLAELGFARVLVEGGGWLNFELLRLGLVDEVHAYLAPLVFGGASAPTLADGPGLARDAAVRLNRQDVEVHEDGGVVLRYHVAI